MSVRMGTSEHGGTFYYSRPRQSLNYQSRGSGADQCVVQTSDASIPQCGAARRPASSSSAYGVQLDRSREKRDGAIHQAHRRAHGGPANAGPMCFVKLASSPIRSVADFNGKSA